MDVIRVFHKSFVRLALSLSIMLAWKKTVSWRVITAVGQRAMDITAWWVCCEDFFHLAGRSRAVVTRGLAADTDTEPQMPPCDFKPLPFEVSEDKLGSSLCYMRL